MTDLDTAKAEKLYLACEDLFADHSLGIVLAALASMVAHALDQLGDDDREFDGEELGRNIATFVDVVLRLIAEKHKH